MPNQTDPNQVADTASTPPVSVQHTDLPPLPDFMNVPASQTPPASTTPQATPPADNSSGPAAPPDLPPVAATPKKKFGGGKIIATILGLVLLVGGVGAGVVLTQQQQIFKPKATASCSCSAAKDSQGNLIRDSSGKLSCSANAGSSCGGGSNAICYDQGSYCSCGCSATITCVNGQTQSCTCSNGSTSTQTCSNNAWGSCNCGGTAGGCSAADIAACVAQGKTCTIVNGNALCSGKSCPSYFCIGTDGRHASNTACGSETQVDSCIDADGKTRYCCKSGTAGGGACALTGSEICVGNVPTGDCYQGSTGGQYACYKLKGDRGKKLSNCSDANSTCNCTCPSPYTWLAHENGGWWCFNTNTTASCAGEVPYAERCSLTPQQCGSGTPPPGTPPPAAPMCVAVSAYDASWGALTPAQLSTLAVGAQVNFCVSGSAPSGTFDKAQFMINTTLEPETTTKRPSSDNYCQSYTILSTDTTVNVKAKIHHTTLGWFGESI